MVSPPSGHQASAGHASERHASRRSRGSSSPGSIRAPVVHTANQPPAFPHRPSRGPRTGKLLRPQPHASCAACPDRAKPRQSLLRAAAACRRCVLWTPPAPRASSGRRRRRARGERWQRRGKMPFKLPSMLPLLSSPPPAYVFLPSILCALGHMPPIGLVASCGVETSCLQRPSIRAASHTRPPMLSASFDERWQACGRRPHLSDGFFARPGRATGHRHQPLGSGGTQPRNTAYTSLSRAPAGNTPVSKHRQSATRNFRATATIPMRLRRLPPPPKRSRHQQRSALSGW
jgi:hypothetical protein